MTWSAEMDLALVTQVVFVGVKAFVTSKANTPTMAASEKWNHADSYGLQTKPGVWRHWGRKEVGMDR